MNGIYLPTQQLTDWLFVEVALLLIGLTLSSLTKSSFDHLSSLIESSLRLRTPAGDVQDGCLSTMATHEWCCLSKSVAYPRSTIAAHEGCCLSKMAAYLNTHLTSLPFAMSPSPLCDRDIQDGCLSTMAALHVNDSVYPRWRPIQDGGLSKMATSRRAHPRWLPVKDGCCADTLIKKKKKNSWYMYILGNSDGSCCKVIYEKGLPNM